MNVPAYLAQQDTGEDTHVYGDLAYDETSRSWVIDAEPAAVEMAKRLFPGSTSLGPGRARFPDGHRTNGDLNWFLLRYPLRIVDPARWERARGEAVRHVVARLESLRNPVKAGPGARFHGTLLPFQGDGLSFLLTNRRTLLADEMGLGKSVQATALLSAESLFPALIVAPSNTLRQWRRLLQTFLWPRPASQPSLFEDVGSEVPVHIIKGLRPYDLPDAEVYLTHYGLLRGWKRSLPVYGFKAVVFDEIQELRHAGTEKYSAASLLAEAVESVIGLSGTPIYNHGAEIWNVLNILEYHCLGDYDSFTREWCEGYGKDVVRQPDVLGDYLKREGLLLRRTKNQVMADLPPKRRVVQEIDLDEGVFSELIADAVAIAERLPGVKEVLERGRLTREIEQVTRRATGVAKAPYVAAFVKMLLEAGEKVLLFAYHHDVFRVYRDVLAEYFPVQITGLETAKQKDEAIAAFARGDTRLAVLSLRTSAGLDNLQSANIVVFGELDWSPAIHSLDVETEILTDKGFLGVDELQNGDLVAGFDIEDGSIRFVPATNKTDRLAGPDETFYRVKTKKLDLVVTGQHRMVYRRVRRIGAKSDGPPWGTPVRSEWVIGTAEEIAGVKRRFVPTAGRQQASGVALSDDELRLIGLYLSDGHFNGRQLIIYQAKKQPWNDEIVRILDGAGMSWSLFERKTSNGHGPANWYHIPAGDQPRWTESEVARLMELKAAGASNTVVAEALSRTANAVGLKWRKIRRGHVTDPGVEKPRKGFRSIAAYLDKDLSPLLESVTEHQLECLVQGIFLGDGAKTGLDTRRITNTNKVMLDRLQSLCVRRGKTAILAERKTKTTAGNAAYDLSISERTEAYLQDAGEFRFQPDAIPAEGQRVWCVQNELSTIVVRRNGKVAIVGNSQAEDRAHRIGQKDSVLSYYLVASEGSDEAIQEALGLKVSQFAGIVGDAAETEEDRMLAQTAVGSHLAKIADKLRLRATKSTE